MCQRSDDEKAFRSNCERVVERTLLIQHATRRRLGEMKSRVFVLKLRREKKSSFFYCFRHFSLKASPCGGGSGVATKKQWLLKKATPFVSKLQRTRVHWSAERSNPTRRCLQQLSSLDHWVGRSVGYLIQLMPLVDLQSCKFRSFVRWFNVGSVVIVMVATSEFLARRRIIMLCWRWLLFWWTFSRMEFVCFNTSWKWKSKKKKETNERTNADPIISICSTGSIESDFLLSFVGCSILPDWLSRNGRIAMLDGTGFLRAENWNLLYKKPVLFEIPLPHIIIITRRPRRPKSTGLQTIKKRVGLVAGFRTFSLRNIRICTTIASEIPITAKTTTTTMRRRRHQQCEDDEDLRAGLFPNNKIKYKNNHGYHGHGDDDDE